MVWLETPVRGLFRRRIVGLHVAMHPSIVVEEFLALESAVVLDAQTESWLEGGRSRFLTLCCELRELPSTSTVSTPGVLSGLCVLIEQVWTSGRARCARSRRNKIKSSREVVNMGSTLYVYS